MPTQTEHLEQAQHNERLVVELRATGMDYLDWCITATFYSALHVVESYLATRGTPSRDHTERDAYVRLESGLRRIYPHYRRLKNASIIARYQCSWQQEDLESYRHELRVIRLHLGV